jgi:hypothetical protein
VVREARRRKHRAVARRAASRATVADRGLRRRLPLLSRHARPNKHQSSTAPQARRRQVRSSNHHATTHP